VRTLNGGVAHVACVVEDDLYERGTGLRKPHLEGLADVIACALSCRSANTAEWQAVLPRRHVDDKSKERYVSRLLANPLISPLRVMQGFIPEIAEMAGSNGKTIILPMDQSRIADGFECLMLSLRTGERALPLTWEVRETCGSIGFERQKPLLDAAFAAMLPESASILLLGDRFYGTAALIRWCQEHGWDYRLRLRENLVLHHEGGELTTGEAAKAGLTVLQNVCLGESGVETHIGILHEKGPPEPWIIAMSEPPSKGRVLDYGMRWGIEPLFSDFKSRGFGITKTQLRHPDRIERLILVLTIALYWAASTGRQPKPSRYTQKNKPAA
jgi:Transposase DDE domain